MRTGRLKTAEEFVEHAAPQITGREEWFRSEIRERLQGRTLALEDLALEDLAVELLARGLSVRGIEDVFKDETGRLLLSRTAISEIGERLWADYQEFASRDLGEHDCQCRMKTPRLRRSKDPRSTGRTGSSSSDHTGPTPPDTRTCFATSSEPRSRGAKRSGTSVLLPILSGGHAMSRTR